MCLSTESIQGSDTMAAKSPDAFFSGKENGGYNGAFSVTLKGSSKAYPTTASSSNPKTVKKGTYSCDYAYKQTGDIKFRFSTDSSGAKGYYVSKAAVETVSGVIKSSTSDRGATSNSTSSQTSGSNKLVEQITTAFRQDGSRRSAYTSYYSSLMNAKQSIGATSQDWKNLVVNLYKGLGIPFSGAYGGSFTSTAIGNLKADIDSAFTSIAGRKSNAANASDAKIDEARQTCLTYIGRITVEGGTESQKTELTNYINGVYQEYKKARSAAAEKQEKAVETSKSQVATQQAQEAAVEATLPASEREPVPTDVAPNIEEFENVTISNAVELGDGLRDTKFVSITSEKFQAATDLYATSYLKGTTLMGTPIGRLSFVHGMPFQYSELADRRPGSAQSLTRWGDASSGSFGTIMKNGSEGEGGSRSYASAYGRSFGANIAANLPIATLVPGKPRFLTNVKQTLFGWASDATGSLKETFLPILSGGDDGSVWDDIMNKAKGGSYEYYSMSIDTEDYFKYVNALCQTSARLLGLHKVGFRSDSDRKSGDADLVGNSTADVLRTIYTVLGDAVDDVVHSAYVNNNRCACDRVDWGKFNTSAEQDFSAFQDVTGLDDGVSFAFEPQSTFNDTISTQTQESQFAGMFNSLSSKTRELEFMLGQSGTGINFFNSSDYEEAVTKVGSGNVAGLGVAANRVKTWLSNTTHGMNIKFPEIWGDTSHSRSYDMEMKFIAPYASNYCKWRYVLVPFFHIFAMAAAHSEDVGNSQYQSPFLVRAFCKGYFNVEMGIIESISWKRFGDGDMISEDMVPMEIDVNISFKDLYHQLSITKGSFGNISRFLNNSGLMEMVGTLSGVNMNRMSLAERISLIASSEVSRFGTVGGNYQRKAANWFRNTFEPILYG